MPARRRLRDLAPAILLFALGALVVAGLPWRCPVLAITGLPCPTCGLTRATRLALHGDFAAATRMHPLWFVVVPATGALGVAEVVSFWRGGAWGRAIEHRWTLRIAVVVLTALILVWVARFAGAFGGPVGKTRQPPAAHLGSVGRRVSLPGRHRAPVGTPVSRPSDVAVRAIERRARRGKPVAPPNRRAPPRENTSATRTASRPTGKTVRRHPG